MRLWGAHHAAAFIRAPPNNHQAIIRQWSLQCLGLIPWRSHPHVALSSVVKMTGIALGRIGSTTAFGDVVKNPQTR